MTSLQDFRDLAARLASDPKNTILLFEVGNPAKAELIAEVAREWQIRPELLGLWAEANGLALVWKSEHGGDLDAGCLVGEGIEPAQVQDAATGIINLLPLEQLRNWREADSVYRFDNHQAECGAALKIDGTDNPTVVYYEDEARAMDIDLAGYFELLMLTAGIEMWYCCLTEDNWYDPELAKKALPGVKLSDVKATAKRARARL